MTNAFRNANRTGVVVITGAALMCGVLIEVNVRAAVAAQTSGERRASDEDHKGVDDLARRLIRGDKASGDVMSEIIGRMEWAAERLEKSFDVGVETQDLQRSIIEELDAAIAASIRKGRSSGSGSAMQQDVRKRSSGRRTDQAAGDEPGLRGSAGAGARGEKSAKAVERFRESGRGWGHLPARDRDEVIQGRGDRSLEKFREWIERYYRSLAEERSP